MSELNMPAVVAEPNPYADWKSGDSVRCLEAADSGEFLADKHVYEIDNGPFFKSDKWRIRLVGLPRHEWNCERFERVAPIVDVHSEPDKPVVRVGSRVRCDDDDGAANPWIVAGDTYIVSAFHVMDDEPMIGVDGDLSASWRLSRFTLLPDEVAPVVPAVQADFADADLMTADEARRRCDALFMANGRELRLEVKTAIDAAVANGNSRANIHVSDELFGSVKRWLAKNGYSLSSIEPGFTWRMISWE